MPMVGIAAILLMGAAGFAVDTGFHQYQQRMQQTATDSAAIAGAQELQNGNFVAAARADAATNGFNDNTGATSCPAGAGVGTVCVEVYNPPQPGDAFAGNTSAVEVDITAYHPTFFEKVFNVNNVPVTTKSVAVLKALGGSVCIYQLDPSKGANFNATTGGALNIPTCGLMLNGPTNFNNNTVDAGFIDCASTCSNGTFTGSQPTSSPPIADPCPGITQCAYLAKNAPTCAAPQSPPAVDALGNVTVPAGCYNGFTYHNGTTTNPSLTVNFCGLYVITGTADVSSTGTGALPITITEPLGCPGVTFYVTGNGAINFRNANMLLNAPTSGDYSQYAAGENKVLFYQTSDDTNTANLQSATCLTCVSQISGLMYFPSANLNYTKSIASLPGLGTLIVSYDLNCNGCAAGSFPAPVPGMFNQTQAVLGE